jgi:ABC-type branched-subunit amino acid transport system substrate-binding protein
MQSMKWLVGVAGLAIATAASAQQKIPGVTTTEISIGQSAPLSGPASAFGIYSRIYDAYFKMVNENGGINGRKISFHLLDNGFSPPKALEMSRKLVEEIGVLAEVGTVGTPTNTATQRYLNGKQVPQLLISAGGSKFNDPKQYPWTVPFYPQFETEAAGYAKYVLKSKPDAKIAVLYQNDDYGKDFLKGLKKGLGEANQKMIVAEASYELSDPTVESQIISLKASGANVLMNFTTPKFAAQAIRKAQELGWTPLQFVCSPSNSLPAVLVPVGLDKSVGLLSAQFYKQPGDPAWDKDQGVIEFMTFMKKYAPNEAPTDSIGISGYVNVLLADYVLRKAGKDLNRENLITTATTIKEVTLPMLLPGIVLSNTPTNYSAYHNFRLSRFDGKAWVAVETIKAE